MPQVKEEKIKKVTAKPAAPKVVAEKISLPKELFSSKINLILIAQAVRVYLANQRQGTQSAKSRGDVSATTRKVYKQKGTGRARHGSRSAPIFVGGGVTFAPKPRDFSLKLSDKMKKQALVSALSAQNKEGNIQVAVGINKLPLKTKEAVKFLDKLTPKKPFLVVLPGGWPEVVKSMRNIEGCQVKQAIDLSTYDVVSNRSIIIASESLPILEGRFK